MPIPQPKDKEERSVFISRCMGNSVMVKEYPDPKQRAAICISTYKRHEEPKKKEDSKDKDSS